MQLLGLTVFVSREQEGHLHDYQEKCVDQSLRYVDDPGVLVCTIPLMSHFIIIIIKNLRQQQKYCNL